MTRHEDRQVQDEKRQDEDPAYKLTYLVQSKEQDSHQGLILLRLDRIFNRCAGLTQRPSEYRPSKLLVILFDSR